VRCVEQPRPVVAELFGGRDVPRGVKRGRELAEILIVAGTASGPCREAVAEHGQPALGLLGGGLVLQDIPVFGEQAVLHAHDVHGDPVGRQPGVGEPAVQHHVVALAMVSAFS
jgi:hypothetical protein